MTGSTLKYRIAAASVATVTGVLVAIVAHGMPTVARSADAVTPQALASKLEWRSVGPYIGGRVVAVEGVVGQPDLFYMGAVDGGVWKSTNYGISWQNISDGWPSASDSIGAIAVAPSNSNVIYVGTGESDIRNDMITGDGIYKTIDAGKTWTYAGLRATHTTMSLVVDPNDPDVVYAASMGHVFVPDPHRGVFKTTDGGKTWKKVLFINDKTGVVDLVMNPRNPQVLYAAAWQAYRTPWKLSSGGPGSGLYETTDGGAHWTNITDHRGLPKGVLLGKIGVTVAASDPNVVYALIEAKGKAGGVFRSNNGGISWQHVNANWKLRQRPFYFMAIFADPTDPNTVYVPTDDSMFVSHDGGTHFTMIHTPFDADNHIVWINPTDPKILLEGNDGGATVSTDGGRTWSTEHNQPTGQFYHANLDDQFPFHIYGAQQDEGSWEGPSAGADQSIPLADWHQVGSGEATVVVPQPGNPKIVYGSEYYSLFWKNDGTTHQVQDVSPWPDFLDGRSSAAQKYRFGWTHPILFSPTNRQELLIGSQYVMKSDDHGETWKVISPDLTRNDPATEGPTGGPVDHDQTGGEIYPIVSALAVSPLDGHVIWAGSSDGLVHVTTDGGARWRAVRPAALPPWADVTSIQPSTTDRGAGYLTASRYQWDDFKPYVFATTDYGRTWHAITRGLPDDQYVFVVRQDPVDANLLFLGTKNTVYVSFDAGANWQPLTLNLPHAQVRDLAIDSREGELVAATHGRSFWILDDLSLLEQIGKQPNPAANAAYLFAPQRVWLSHFYGASSGIDSSGATSSLAMNTAGQNPPFGATVFFRIPENYDGKTPVTLTFSTADGAVIRRFKLHPSTAADREAAKAFAAQVANDDVSTEVSQRQQAAESERELTTIEPGMNRFQWDLRYPDATNVEGFVGTVPADTVLAETVAGPQVVPGTYRATLDYGGVKTQRTFTVALDPGIKASQADLVARFALQTKILEMIDRLDRTINQAIDLRDQLDALRANHGARGPQAAAALASLNRSIDAVVNLKLHGAEDDAMQPPRLHSHLGFLLSDVDYAYARPTRAQVQVFEQFKAEAETGERNLHAAIDLAEAHLRPGASSQVHQ
jgi:photosystem II stability/assembly factor-like uncharacterized protein